MATDGGETIGTSDRPRSTGRMAGRRWRGIGAHTTLVLQLPDPASTRVAPVPLGMGRGGLGARPVARWPVPGAEEWSPRRIRFDTVIEGMATRAVLDGAPYYRTFTP